jgi:thymidylate kinase
MKTSSERTAFLRRLLVALGRGRYALLKFTHASIDELPPSSDLDVLVEGGYVDRLLEWMSTDPAVERVRPLRRSFMVMVRVFLRDGGFVEVDLIHAFVRKSVEYLDATAVLSGARPGRGEGWSVPALEHEFAYPFLFSVLNGSDMPSKHREYFSSLGHAEQARVLESINATYGLAAESLADLFTYSRGTHERVQEALTRQPSNRGLKRARRLSRYVADVARRERGLVVTFSGVDGAGKSTVLEAARQELQGTYRQTVRVLRHRPSLLPILSALVLGKAEAERRSTARLPRTGTNGSSVSSALRFAYYFADYLVGQFVIFWKYTMRGEVVLYDRYYFDFIVDPRRTNVRLNRRLTEFLYAFLLEPDLNFFLYASPEVIVRRKRELPRDVVEELTQEYNALFDRLDAGARGRRRYHAIENVVLAETMAQVTRTIARSL